VTRQPSSGNNKDEGTAHGDDFIARFEKMPTAVRIVYGRPRTFIALALGLVSLPFLPDAWRLATRLLVAWDIFTVFYLAFAYATMFSFNTDRIRRQAKFQDDGRFIILVMTGVGAFASLAAIILELGVTPRQTPQLVLAVATIALTWARSTQHSRCTTRMTIIATPRRAASPSPARPHPTIGISSISRS
jgi:hypothetical protein